MEAIFCETLSLEVWKAKYGPMSRRTQANPPTDSSTTTSSLLADGSELDDKDKNVQPPVPTIPPLVADMHELTTASATNDEGSLGALHVAPAKEPRAVEMSPTEELSANEELAGEPMSNKNSAGELTLVQQLTVDKAVFDQEGERSAGEESIESNVVEVPVEKPAPQHSGHLRKAQEQQSYHACLRLIAFTTLLDDAQADVELPELNPDVHADPEHCWDITMMAVKGALASWKGKAVKAAMDEEIWSLIANGTWELVEKYLGLEIVHDRPAREVWLHQLTYVNKLHKHFIDEEWTRWILKTPLTVDAYAELTFDDEESQLREEEYRQKVGLLQFAATMTRLDIAFVCSKLGSGLTVRSDNHWREVDRCLHYLAETCDAALEFGDGPE
ncbi:unnamed protein product [Closterium sp. NIES-53]